ncbi:MAG: metal-dependent hydrolase [Phycisphaerae bacterium]|jgi:inner membrane protein|nr:metal-dependent hydrolase [Phycisphaerae bacterium]
MDTITQCLLGATTAQLGFRQRIGRDATLVAAATALLPDLDIFIAPILALTGTEDSSLAMITHHRGFSHSLVFYPFTAIILASIWWWFRNSVLKNRLNGEIFKNKSAPAITHDRPSFWWLYGCILVALVSHPLLDFFTSYGTQLLMPFTNARYAVDAIPIVDLIYTPILIFTLTACYLVRKIKTDSRTATLIIGWAGFLLSSSYITAGLVLHNQAGEKMRQAVIRQVSPTQTKPVENRFRINAYPQLGTIFVWRGTVHYDNRWYVGRWNFLYDKPIELKSIVEPDNLWVRRARGLSEVKLFDWFTLGQTRVNFTQQNGYRIVEFYDMRYGEAPGSLKSIWFLRVAFSPTGSLAEVDYVHPHRNQSLKHLAGQYWREIFTP